MEEPNGPSPPASSRPAARTKYGKSCTNCSKAKCKCTYPPGRPNCERCDRLNKQCKPLVSVRRGEHLSPTNTPEPVNDDTLNSKINELIALLKVRRSGAAKDASEESPDVEEDDDYPHSPETSLPMHLRLDPTSLAELTDDVTASTTFSEINQNIREQPRETPVPKLPLSPEQATRCFFRFRQVMLPWLPFMYVPDSMTVTELQRTWPTLHLCIMATAAISTSQLYDWSEQFRHVIVKKLYDSGERSLDILLAILTFIGWLRHHRQERPFFNLWLHMATTLVSDLGLDKRAETDNTWWPWHRESVQGEQSMVEQRAVMAVFVLSSISASSIKSVDSLQWTPHMDFCLQNLEENAECQGDQVLAIQARCCLITEFANRVGQPSWPFTSRYMTQAVSLAIPQKSEVMFALETQIAELQNKVRTLGLEGHIVITMSIVSTELDIYEAIANPEQPIVDQTITPSEKLSRFNRQLDCLRRWWDAFLTINPEHFPDVSFLILTQLIHSVCSLFRLTILQYPGWDRQAVRNFADVTEYLSSFATIVESAHQKVGLTCDRGDDVLIKTAKTMRKLRQHFLNILIMIDPSSGITNTSSDAFSEAMPDMMDPEFWSNQWLTDMIMSWEK